MALFPPALLNIPYAIRLDEADATTTYLGKADPGSANGDGVWRIQRITTSGSLITIEWADGDNEFDNIWNDRATLSYS